MIRLIAVGVINVVGAMTGPALRPEAHLVTALILADFLGALDAAPFEADPLVQVRALRSIGDRRVQRYPVVAAVKRTRIIIKGNVSRVLKLDMPPEDVAVTALAVPRVVGRELLPCVDLDRACPLHALERPATEIQIGSLHPAILGGLALRLRRRVALDRLALGGRSAPVVLTANSEPSRAAQPIPLRGTDALARGAAHGPGEGGAVTLTAACAIRVRHFSTGSRQEENERREGRAKGRPDVSSRHG
jgi:hypothetical protein